MKLEQEYSKKNFKGRRFVMGDIHGGYAAMKKVLEKSNFDYENDLLIQLGDVVDGWSESKEVIDELSKIKNLVYMLGNHDEWALEYYNGDTYNPVTKDAHIRDMWFLQGGKSTIESLGRYKEQDPKYLEFLKKGKLYYTINDGEGDIKIFAHGNIPSKVFNLDKCDSYSFIWDRWLIQKAARRRNNQKWIDKRFSEIYLGHSQVQYLMSSEEHQNKPQKMTNLWAMDTGAAYKGKVSLLDIDNKTLYQSDFVCKYYPDEKGRNPISYNDHIGNGGEPI